MGSGVTRTAPSAAPTTIVGCGRPPPSGGRHTPRGAPDAHRGWRQLPAVGGQPHPRYAHDVPPLRLHEVLEARELEVDRARLSHAAVSVMAGAAPEAQHWTFVGFCMFRRADWVTLRSNVP